MYVQVNYNIIIYMDYKIRVVFFNLNALLKAFIYASKNQEKKIDGSILFLFTNKLRLFSFLLRRKLRILKFKKLNSDTQKLGLGLDGRPRPFQNWT